MELQIETLMGRVGAKGGSDLHPSAGLPPYGRFSGALRPMHEAPLAEESCNRLIFSLLNNNQRKQLEQNWELDCSYGLKGVARFGSMSIGKRGAMPPACGPWAAAFPAWSNSACPMWCARSASGREAWCW